MCHSAWSAVSLIGCSAAPCFRARPVCVMAWWPLLAPVGAPQSAARRLGGVRGRRVELSAMPERVPGAPLRFRAGPARPAVAFMLPPSGRPLLDRPAHRPVCSSACPPAAALPLQMRSFVCPSPRLLARSRLLRCGCGCVAVAASSCSQSRSAHAPGQLVATQLIPYASHCMHAHVTICRFCIVGFGGGVQL